MTRSVIAFCFAFFLAISFSYPLTKLLPPPCWRVEIVHNSWRVAHYSNTPWRFLSFLVFRLQDIENVHNSKRVTHISNISALPSTYTKKMRTHNIYFFFFFFLWGVIYERFFFRRWKSFILWITVFASIFLSIKKRLNKCSVLI